uniref:Uncharacterized protein n=1 Tax=Caenorhabditis japonica TaxID=281687 RepID=A0A8R1EBW6_CAEJA
MPTISSFPFLSVCSPHAEAVLFSFTTSTFTAPVIYSRSKPLSSLRTLIATSRHGVFDIYSTHPTQCRIKGSFNAHSRLFPEPFSS